MIRDTIIEYVDSISFLGVVLDKKLSFRAQGLSVTSKLSRSLGIIRKISSFVPVSGLLKLYYSHFLFPSHLCNNYLEKYK